MSARPGAPGTLLSWSSRASCRGGRGPSVLLAPPHASPGPVPQDVLVCRSHLSQLGAASPCGFQDPSIHPASHSAPAGSRLGAARGHTPAPPPLPRGLLPPPGRGQPRGHQPAGEDRRGRHCPEHDWDLWPSGRHAPLLPQTDRCSSPHYPPSAPRLEEGSPVGRPSPVELGRGKGPRAGGGRLEAPSDREACSA